MGDQAVMAQVLVVVLQAIPGAQLQQHPHPVLQVVPTGHETQDLPFQMGLAGGQGPQVPVTGSLQGKLAGQSQVKALSFQTPGAGQVTHCLVLGLQKGVAAAHWHLALLESKVKPGGQHSHFPVEFSQWVSGLQDWHYLAVAFQKLGATQATHIFCLFKKGLSVGQLHCQLVLSKMKPGPQQRHFLVLGFHTPGSEQATHLLVASRQGVAGGHQHKKVVGLRTNPELLRQATQLKVFGFQSAGGVQETQSPAALMLVSPGGQTQIFWIASQILLLGHESQVLVFSFHQVGGVQEHHPVALTVGRLGGQTQIFWLASQTLLVGHESQSFVCSLRYLGGVQEHLPSGVAKVSGGQQILRGPVGEVPVGQTHWRSLLSKMQPVGQQWKPEAWSWFKESACEQASRPRTIRRVFCMKIFQKLQQQNSHSFQIVPKQDLFVQKSTQFQNVFGVEPTAAFYYSWFRTSMSKK